MKEKIENLFESEIRLDNTKRSVYKVCPRKFYLAHILNLQSKNGSTALRFGSTWHAFMEGFYTVIKIEGWGDTGINYAVENALKLGKKAWEKESEDRIFWDDYRTFENCSKMFLEYITEFSSDCEMIDIIDSESVFACPIELENEEEKILFSNLPPVIFTGKIDLQLELNGIPWIMEFKTTGFSLDSLVKRLNRNTQVLGYSYAAKRVLSFKPEGVLVSFAFCSSRKGKDGNYGKLSIGFQRAPQLFNQQDFNNWKYSYLSTAKNIYEDWKKGYFALEFDSCYNYNYPCTYSSICEGNRDVMRLTTDEVIDCYPNFIEKKWDVEATETEEN